MLRFPAIVMVCLAASSVALADEKPSDTKDKKSEPTWHLSSGLIIKQVKEVPHMLSGQAKTDFTKIGETLDEIFFPLMKQSETNGIRVQSPVYFAYDGVTGDPTKEFSLMTGFPVREYDKPFGNFKIRKLPAFRAATVYYTGPVASMWHVYPKVYEMIEAKKLKPTGHHRELYMFFESEESPRNVVEIQIGIE